MTDSATLPAPAPMSLPARMFGVLFSPRETFASVARYPTWLGVLAVSLIVLAGANYLFLSTPVGQQASLDQQVAQIEGFGQTVDDAMYATLKERAKYSAAITAAAILLVSPIFTLLFAGLLFGIFSGVLGGQATYKQVLAVLAHTSVLNVVQALFVTPLNYVRETMSSATSLGVFLPMLPEGSFLSNFFGAIDLFILWSVAITAIGLSVLYKRRTMPVFLSLVLAYVVIALAIAAVKAALGGS
jgi:hypothetical protein